MERKLLDMMNQLFISEYNSRVEYGAQFQFVKLKILSIERNALLHTLFAGGGQLQRTVNCFTAVRHHVPDAFSHLFREIPDQQQVSLFHGHHRRLAWQHLVAGAVLVVAADFPVIQREFAAGFRDPSGRAGDVHQRIERIFVRNLRRL